MKKAFDDSKAANQFARQQLFLFRCFLLCGLLFHWHGYVPPCGTFSLDIGEAVKAAPLIAWPYQLPQDIGLRRS
jgi:hypothetical protein